MLDSSQRAKHKINIEYCRSCETHNWCTHHNEQKYKQAFLSLREAIHKEFPALHVVGNQLPANLVPIKAKQNKYYDSKTQKYVIFPSVGSFQVYFNQQLIFSKRSSNSWPTNSEILNTIHVRVLGAPRRNQTQESEKQTEKLVSEKQEKETVRLADQILSNLDRNSTMYRQKQRQQLTLTDHFKKYNLNKKSQDDLQSLYAESEKRSASTISPITAEDIMKLHQIWGKKENLPNFIKDKALIQLREGKREMLVNLSSIEEENELRECLAPPKSRKNKISNLQIQFQKLEKKFRKFECRVSQVNRKKFDFQPTRQYKQMKEKNCNKFSFIQKIQQVKTAYNPQKFVTLIKDKKKRMIEEYIHATSEEKNEKLEQIYGPQYLKLKMGNSKVRANNSQIMKESFNASRRQTSNLTKKQFSNDQPSESSSHSDSKAGGSKKEIATTCMKKQLNATQDCFFTKKRSIHSRKSKQSSEARVESRHHYLSSFQKQKRLFHSRSLIHKPAQQKTNNLENIRRTQADENQAQLATRQTPASDKNTIIEQAQNMKGPIKANNRLMHLTKSSKSNLSLSKKWDIKSNQPANACQKNALDDINQLYQLEETHRKHSKSSSSSEEASKRQNQAPVEVLVAAQKQPQVDKKTPIKKSTQNRKPTPHETSLNPKEPKVKKQRRTKRNKRQEMKCKQETTQERQSGFHNDNISTTQGKKSKMKNLRKKPQKMYRQLGLNCNQSNQDDQIGNSIHDSSFVSSERESEKSNSSSYRDQSLQGQECRQNLQNVKKKPSEKLVNQRQGKAVVQQKIDEAKKQGEQSEQFMENIITIGKNASGTNSWMTEQRAFQNEALMANQTSNVGSDSRPRRIYEIDEEKPETFDVGVQKNFKAPVREKESQTLHEDDDQSSLEASRHPDNSFADKDNRISGNQGCTKISGEIKKEEQESANEKEKEKEKEKDQEKEKQIYQSKNQNENDECLENSVPQNSQHFEEKQKERMSRPMELRKEEGGTNCGKENMKILNDQNSKVLFKKSLCRQRASMTKQLYGCQYETKLNGEPEHEMGWKGSSESRKTIPIKELYKQNNRFSKLFDKESIGCSQIVLKEVGMENLGKIIKILCERNQFLIIRLFENPELVEADAYRVWLCRHCVWNCYEVRNVAIDQKLEPVTMHHLGFQRWPPILVEALSLMFGGLENLSLASITDLFHALTGSSFLTFKVKEDPEKNSRLLKFISENERKNFIIRAEKRIHYSLGQSLEDKKESSSFFILSQKVINEKQTLLRMKKTNSQAFWIKLEKFVSEFSQVDVLQLRINHNFCTITLPDCNTGHFQIVELLFPEECFGSVVAVTDSNSADFKMYLYKEEQDSILRLVGQVTDRNKKMTFFDCCFAEGKYLLFADIKSSSNRICYMGEGRPRLRVKQEIKEFGLKSDYSEYIPVKRVPQKKQSQMPAFLDITRKSENSPILSIESGPKPKKPKQESLDIHRIREQFVNYLAQN